MSPTPTRFAWHRPAEGYPGRRLVEPYELRRTRAGNLVLLAVNGQGETRTYRIERIAAARPTNQPYTPRYIVALCDIATQKEHTPDATHPGVVRVDSTTPALPS